VRVSGYHELVVAMVGKSAKIDLANTRGVTALMLASRSVSCLSQPLGPYRPDVQAVYISWRMKP
jgi:hypothetical protein